MRTLDLGFVAPNVVRPDGQGRVMLELVRAAAEAGHRATVYAVRLDDELAGTDRVEHVAIRPRPSSPQMLAAVSFSRAARRALRRRGHDLVCVMGACTRSPMPYVYYAEFSAQGWRERWGGSPPRLHHRLHARLSARRERKALCAASGVVAASRTVASEVHECLRGGATPPVDVVPNGVDLDEFPRVTPEARTEARARFGLSPDDFVIGFVGEFNTTRKGLEPLAAAVAAGGDSRERLLVAGEGSPTRLGALAGTPRAVLAGRVVPIGPVYAAADVVAIPSLYEPFSNVATEAAASGVPFALSVRAGAYEWLDGACAPIQDPADPGSIRAALDALHPDGKRAALAERARAVAERLSWRATARRALSAILDMSGLAVAEGNGSSEWPQEVTGR